MWLAMYFGILSSACQFKRLVMSGTDAHMLENSKTAREYRSISAKALTLAGSCV
jgi:hypothetical protein